MRALYTVLWLVALPFLPLRLWWRGRREAGYRERIGERYGRYRSRRAPPAPVLWIHAVSLGETRAAVPLVLKLRQSFGDASILLTHMTATGRAAGHEILGDSVTQAWLPYDAPFAVRGFLRHFRPAAGLVVETELWPNLLAAARASDIPMFLVNARLSERSAAGYRRIAPLARATLTAFTGVAAQSEADAQRLASLGAPPPIVTGNLKFDSGASESALALGRELRMRFGDERPVFVAASTRDGEEALLLDALTDAALPPSTLTIIVPRHPQRFAAVADLLHERGIAFARRSDPRPVPADIAIVLGDSMGELAAYYAAADIAFVGGSLLPLGGQNLIEPIALGRPTLVGPHTWNFAEAAVNARAAGALIEVVDARMLLAEVAALFADRQRRERMADSARAFHAAHRGALDRLCAWLLPQLAPSLARTAPGSESLSPSTGD